MNRQTLLRLGFCAVVGGEITTYLPDTPLGGILKGVVFWLAFYPALEVSPPVPENHWTRSLSRYWTGMVGCAFACLASWGIGATVPDAYGAIGLGALLVACLVAILYQRFWPRKRPV